MGFNDHPKLIGIRFGSKLCLCNGSTDSVDEGNIVPNIEDGKLWRQKFLRFEIGSWSVFAAESWAIRSRHLFLAASLVKSPPCRRMERDTRSYLTAGVISRPLGDVILMKLLRILSPRPRARFSVLKCSLRTFAHFERLRPILLWSSESEGWFRKGELLGGFGEVLRMMKRTWWSGTVCSIRAGLMQFKRRRTK